MNNLQAQAMHLAQTGSSMEVIHQEITERFGYDLTFTRDDFRPSYRFDVSCQGSILQAIVAFLDSERFEDAVRLAVSISGDSDTIACMFGSIAVAFYRASRRTSSRKSSTACRTICARSSTGFANTSFLPAGGALDTGSGGFTFPHLKRFKHRLRQ